VRLLSTENFIDTKTEFMNALNYAAAAGHFEIAKLLLDRVTDIKSVKIQDISRDALASASEAGHLEIVKLLLAKGAAVDADDQKVVPLIEASRTGHFEIVHLLLANGANVNAKDKTGMTALIGASGQISWVLDSAMTSGRLGRKQLKTCDFHHRGHLQGYLDIIKLLLINGADINIKEHSGNTALTYAALTGQLDTTKLLLDNRADINTKTNDGDTILMSMLQHGGNIDVMKLLLAKGIDINVRNKRNETAMTYASRYACPKAIMTLLKQADAKE
jgi:ankyrin repeat protein